MDWLPGNLSAKYDYLWSRRDTRVDGMPLMSSPVPTILICLSYVLIVKVLGPAFMRDRKPMDIRGFLIFYNAFQVALSTYIFVELILTGWGGQYNILCQPVDYSNDPSAIRMLNVCYVYFISKFTEFIDTFCFVARKKFNHISLLHVVHHGIMPCSVWPGMRWVPGGHASFFGLLNTFVHMFMYTYYLVAALGPEYKKYIWWKQHMTSLQMFQFVGIMLHGFQLLFYEECGFPWQISYFIGGHAVMFFFLFAQFYVNEYFSKKDHKSAKRKKSDSNGYISATTNGSTSRNGPVTRLSAKKAA